jgi:ribonuclease HI
MDQPEVVTEDETIDEQTSINFKTEIDEKDVSKEEGKREGQRKRVLTTAPVSLSTKDNPLVIFVDGSDIDKQSADNKIGYGAWFTYNGEDYGLSGTRIDVDRILSQFKDMKMSNPTMEMLGLLEVLRRFKTTKEHIVIRQDYSGAVNYAGLWDRSGGSAQRASKPWVAKEPYIKYLVDEINKAIEQLETNGGSIKIQWVPGHIDSSKISKYADIFKDDQGIKSQSVIDKLTKGNDSADYYAKMQQSVDTMSDLISPIEDVRQLDLFDKINDITNEQAEERKKECE